MSAASFPLVRALFATSLAFALAGCPGESEPEKRERIAAPPSNAIASKTWLQPTDATPPALWLASREAGRDAQPGDPSVASWRALLDDADERFGENDRMIANRAIQLETMLGEIHQAEGARALVADLSALASKGSRSGFSDLCQHYFNLRNQGLSRGAAFDVLRAEPVRATQSAVPEGSRP